MHAAACPVLSGSWPASAFRQTHVKSGTGGLTGSSQYWTQNLRVLRCQHAKQHVRCDLVPLPVHMHSRGSEDGAARAWPAAGLGDRRPLAPQAGAAGGGSAAAGAAAAAAARSASASGAAPPLAAAVLAALRFRPRGSSSGDRFSFAVSSVARTAPSSAPLLSRAAGPSRVPSLLNPAAKCDAGFMPARLSMVFG